MLRNILTSRTYLGSYLDTPLYIHGSTIAFITFVITLNLLTSGLLAAANVAWFILCIAFCVTVHEYGHIYAAQRYGNYTQQVVLWPFGGMAHILPPQTAKETIVVCGAGPLSNFIMALIATPILFLILKTPVAPLIATFVGVNLALGIFNLIPAYPMDGGRIFQGIVWYFKGYHTATRWAVKLSKVFVPLFIVAAFFLKSFMLVIIAAFIWMYCSKNPEEGSVM